MSNMDRKTAPEVITAYQVWHRYNGPIEGSPDMQDPGIIGKAIDVAIHELERLCQEPPEKEFYGG